MMFKKFQGKLLCDGIVSVCLDIRDVRKDVF